MENIRERQTIIIFEEDEKMRRNLVSGAKGLSLNPVSSIKIRM